jgi:HEAT repeat protein
MLTTIKLRSPLEKHRIEGIRELRGKTDSKSIQAMISALYDHSTEVQVLACEGLGQVGALAAITNLASLLRHPDDPQHPKHNIAYSVREAAAAALANMSDGQGLPILHERILYGVRDA